MAPTIHHIKPMMKRVEMPGIEPGASYMQSMRSTTELHPLIEQTHTFMVLIHNDRDT